jgi:hypothetical protein
MMAISERLQDASARAFPDYVERQVDLMFQAYRELPGADDPNTAPMGPPS